MAFWGVEVKPGKPFAHKCDGLGGRLHISMATLGFGCATAKSILQCNVGNKSPVYLCSLSSGMSESLQLNLEFEEVDDVIFSVVGPRSIHLCGYYLGRGQNTNINEESESYGEDIANTETERSDYNDEDDYEDSFIDDDGDPEVYPPSPISDEGMLNYASKVKKSRGRHRQLRRKYRSVESDDDKSFEENKIVDSNMHDHAKTPDEDSMPISSLFKRKPIARVLDLEMDVSDDTREGDSGNKNGVDGCNGISNSNSKDDNVLVNSQTHR
ncbi:peptidyl-prolyl cis-trans isomerase FKBP43-like isoform X1 [Senna tora]|uniref:peptidylprolyl isomerase n=1 Tax=Senna tora TaxID=362788 RepID=A0A834W669_9FABA|nr:peptidyl-prolyl cis-trans isomerase FKBP43-like isoform X1 [Senna tora]